MPPGFETIQDPHHKKMMEYMSNCNQIIKMKQFTNNIFFFYNCSDNL